MKRRSTQTVARRGRSKPAPYTKYKKQPYVYVADVGRRSPKYAGRGAAPEKRR